MISAFSNRSGFTLLEVVVAIGILAISLVAIFEMQGGNIETAMRTRDITVATLLARSKMIDIERELFEEGFGDFEESMSGTFEEEGWPEFSWEAEITKVEMPIPDSFPGADENPQCRFDDGGGVFHHRHDQEFFARMRADRQLGRWRRYERFSSDDTLYRRDESRSTGKYVRFS